MSRTDLIPLLTVEEAAARLRMSDKQLRGHIRAGNIPFINVGLKTRPSYRFRASDIVEFELSRATACGTQCAGSTAGRVRTTGPMMSSYVVIDFAARRVARKSAQPKNGSPSSGKKNAPR
ncbi:MAG: helix-turn-helix domain-containing protein [Rhizobiales bacterium]|nr:helix-turn-helix domain-containing protein [Hyphomicrobiales bacterium]